MGSRIRYFSNVTKKTFLLTAVFIVLLSTTHSIQILSAQLLNSSGKSTILKSNSINPQPNLETNAINNSLISQVNHWDENFGAPIRIQAKEKLLFYTNVYDGLVIINTSDLEDPTISATLGEFNQQSYYDFHVDADVIYICDIYSTFKAINISNFESPVVLDELAMPLPYQVDVIGDVAYVMDFYGLLYSIDISNPSDLRIISWYDFGKVTLSLFIKEELLFAGHKFGGFTICNISNPSNLTMISSYSSTALLGGSNIWIEGNTAFHIEREEGLAIVNITDLEHPTLISRYNSSEQTDITDIIVYNSIAYIADYYNDIIILNVTDLEHPEKISSIENSYGSSKLEIFNEILFTNEKSGNLNIFNISTQISPVKVSTFFGGGIVFDIAVEDSVAYIANYNGMEIIDTSVQDPVAIGHYSDGLEYRSIFVHNDYAFLSSCYEHYLTIINISNINDPSKVSSFIFEDNKTNIRSVFVQDEKVYLACEEKGLIVIDISNPMVPEEVGNFTLNSIVAVELKNNYAYVIDETNGLVILDIADTNNIKMINSLIIFNDFTLHYLTIKDNYIYLISNTDFYIIDITHPENLGVVGYINQYCGESGKLLGGIIAPPGEIAIQNNLAFITNMYDGVYMFDISNKKNPTLAGYYIDKQITYGLCVDETYIYVAKSYFGMSMYISMINPKASLGAGSIILIIAASIIVIALPLFFIIRKRIILTRKKEENEIEDELEPIEIPDLEDIDIDVKKEDFKSEEVFEYAKKVFDDDD